VKRARKAAPRTLAGLLPGNPRVLKVLQKHGVHFCPGCLLTLTSPLEKVAAYHAVPDIDAFLKDLRRALGRS